MVRKSYFVLVGFLFLLILYACGGGGGGGVNSTYDNPWDSYYKNENSASALVEPAQLYQWVKNGYKTSDGKKVEIIDIVQNPGDENIWFAGDPVLAASKLPGKTDAANLLDEKGYLGHIPGAVYMVSHGGLNAIARNDGPIMAPHEVPSGDKISELLRDLGVTKDKVLVLTQGVACKPGYCQTRLFVHLMYWGFSKKYVKILDGGDIAWADYIRKNHPDEIGTLGLEKGLSLPQIKKSDIDVVEFPKKRFNLRVSLGEMIKLVDEGKTTDGEIALIDARQPPTPFYFDNISYYASKIKKYSLIDKNGQDGLPTFDPTAFSPIAATLKGSQIGAKKLNGGLYPVNFAAKPEAFDGEIKGSLMVKGKNKKGELYNITLPAFINMEPVKNSEGKVIAKVMTGYKKPTDKVPFKWAGGITVEQMFERVFPNKSQPIVVYCNSGTLAGLYWFYLSQVLGYTNVKWYDGSWWEWGNLTAFEPNPDYLKFVESEMYTWFPIPINGDNTEALNSPALKIFGSGNFDYFRIVKDTDGNYIAVDEITGDNCTVGDPGCPVEFGGTLNGNTKWDAVTRSDRVIFRPSPTANSGICVGVDDVNSTKEYVRATDWPMYKTYPNYSGPGDEILKQDENYNGISGASTGGSPQAPSSAPAMGC